MKFRQYKIEDGAKKEDFNVLWNGRCGLREVTETKLQKKMAMSEECFKCVCDGKYSLTYFVLAIA